MKPVNGRQLTRVVALETIPHPLFVGGRNLEPGPGSQNYGWDWFNTLSEKNGIDTYAFMPSKHVRTGRQGSVVFGTRDRNKGLPFDIPKFTMGLKFSDLTSQEIQQYIKAMTLGSLEFLTAIERDGKRVDLVQAAHLFLNPLIAGEINRRRIAGGCPLLGVCATAHGTALKFLRQEQWFRQLEVEDAFGNPGKGEPHNLFIPCDVATYVENEYGEILKRKSDYAKMRGMSAFELNRSLTMPKLMGFRRLVGPYIYRELGAIIAISDEIRGEVLRMFPDYPTDHIHVIYNGYNEGIFHPMTLDRSEVLANLRTSETTGRKALPNEAINADYVVLMTGKFVPWKGVDQLIQAAAGIDPHATEDERSFDGYEASFKKKGKSVVTLVVGTNADDPAYVASMEALPANSGVNHVYFLGHIVPEKLAQLNAIADIAVYPSENEPFGMVAIEAMAMGLSVLVGTGGFRNFVDDEVGGYVDPHSPVDIARQIKVALEQEWKVKKGPKAVERAANYSWSRQFGRYLEVYEEVLRWTRNGHPKGVYKPSRVSYDVPLQSPLRRALFSPYRIAMEMVKLVSEKDRETAASAALFIKLGLRHGHLDIDDAKSRIRNGEHKKVFERIEAANRRG